MPGIVLMLTKVNDSGMIEQKSESPPRSELFPTMSIIHQIDLSGIRLYVLANNRIQDATHLRLALA